MEQNKKTRGLAKSKQNNLKDAEIVFKSKYTKKYFELRRNQLKKVFTYIKPDLQELADYFCPNSVRFIARNAKGC